MDIDKLKQLREQGMSYPQIAKELGTYTDLVKYYGKKLGYISSLPENNPFANCKYKRNPDFFSTINTPEKSYILGLLYADGCNFVKGVKREVTLSLDFKDKYLLEQINQLIGSDRPIAISGNMSILHLTGEMYSNQLIELGCVPKKSLILKFPTEQQVPSHLMSHFIRGYFDGDGCMYYNTSQRIVSIVGTKEFLEGIKRELDKVEAFSGKISKQKNIFLLRLSSRWSVKKFYDYIYQDSTIEMERKRNKFLESFKF